MAHIFDDIKSYQEEIKRHNSCEEVKLESSEEIQLGDELVITGICLDGYYVVATYGKKVEMYMAMDVLSLEIINQISFDLRKRV